jgi:hypothetical protein
MQDYEVIVGNIGRVLVTKERAEAFKTFAHYVEQSQSNRGRAGGEPVTIMQGDEIIREYGPEEMWEGEEP